MYQSFEWKRDDRSGSPLDNYQHYTSMYCIHVTCLIHVFDFSKHQISNIQVTRHWHRGYGYLGMELCCFNSDWYCSIFVTLIGSSTLIGASMQHYPCKGKYILCKMKSTFLQKCILIFTAYPSAQLCSFPLFAMHSIWCILVCTGPNYMCISSVHIHVAACCVINSLCSGSASPLIVTILLTPYTRTTSLQRKLDTVMWEVTWLWNCMDNLWSFPHKADLFSSLGLPTVSKATSSHNLLSVLFLVSCGTFLCPVPSSPTNTPAL